MVSRGQPDLHTGEKTEVYLNRGFTPTRPRGIGGDFTGTPAQSYGRLPEAVPLMGAGFARASAPQQLHELDLAAAVWNLELEASCPSGDGGTDEPSSSRAGASTPRPLPDHRWLLPTTISAAHARLDNGGPRRWPPR
jgi:hypothetical protein